MKPLQRPIHGNDRAFKSSTRAIDNFEDLDDEKFQDVFWTESTLMKARPKTGTKVRKMKA